MSADIKQKYNTSLQELQDLVVWEKKKKLKKKKELKASKTVHNSNELVPSTSVLFKVWSLDWLKVFELSVTGLLQDRSLCQKSTMKLNAL